MEEKLNARHLKTREQIRKKVDAIQSGCGGLLRVDILEQRERVRFKLGRGRPGAHSRYEEREQVSYRLQWCRDQKAIDEARRTDGLFPLVDNTDLVPVDVLATYKKQPFLEKRFHTAKSVFEVAPVFLKTPRRIEAMMFLYFIALMVVSLIERTIRSEMAKENIKSLPIRPTGLPTKAPTWENLQNFFRNVHLAMVVEGQRILRTTVKGIGAIHVQLLRLLKVPLAIYEKVKDGWWLFSQQEYLAGAS
jgi:hypothetical protein